jgi:hypothetical protein
MKKVFAFSFRGLVISVGFGVLVISVGFGVLVISVGFGVLSYQADWPPEAEPLPLAASCVIF